jgi:hypothetical protein
LRGVLLARARLFLPLAGVDVLDLGVFALEPVPIPVVPGSVRRRSRSCHGGKREARREQDEDNPRSAE